MTQRALTLDRPTLTSFAFTPAMVAIAAILTAIVALSLAAIFIRLCEQELGPFATIFNRFWVAFLVLTLWQQCQNWRSPASPFRLPHWQDILLLLSAGLLFWGCLATWAWSLTCTGVANSTILHNLTPLFTTLGAWLLFKQRFDGRFLMGLVIAMGGAIALSLGDLHLGADNFVGDAAALLSAVFSAGNLMVIEKLRSRFTAPTIILWCCFIGALLSLPIALYTEPHLFPLSRFGWFSVIGLAVVCQVIGQGLQAYSLKRLSSGLVGVFLLLDPILAALVAWIIFLEGLSPLNLVAFGIVLLGIYLAKSSRYANQVLATETA